TAASLLFLPVQLANLGLNIGGILPQPGTSTYNYANAILIALLCAGFSWLFFRDARGTRKWWEGIGRSAAFLVGVAVVTSRARSALDGAVVIVAVAVAMDLAAEWRAREKFGELVAVWPVHQVARLDEHLARLAAANIPVLARGEHYRTLLHFF